MLMTLFFRCYVASIRVDERLVLGLVPNHRLQDDRKRESLFCSLTSFGVA
jgi:hypothetical protein